MPEGVLAVVIPAKNERDTIGDAIDEVRDELSSRFSEIRFVVPSSSNDGTDEIAREKGADVIRDGGTGLGEAMFRGLKKALEYDPDLVMSIDADLQFDPAESGKLIAEAEDHDLVLGSRFMESGVTYDMRLSHRIGNHLLTWMVNRFTDLELTDAQTGYRVMKPEVIRELRMIGRHTYVQETVIDAARNGFSIKEKPVVFREREHGGSRVVSSISRYALRTLPVLLHRTGYSVYMLNTASAVTGLAGLALICQGILSLDTLTGGVGVLLSAVSVQIFFINMLLDSEYP